MEAAGKNGGIYTTYSDRFSYSGMTGAFDPIIVAGLKDIDGTTGPATVNALAKAGADPNNPAAAAPDGAYDVEYTMQTGLTRYAPMIPQPPTKITATNTKPLYPTSSVQIAKSHLPIPKVQTTVTQSQTFSVSSRENTVCTTFAGSLNSTLTHPRLSPPHMPPTTWLSSLDAGRIRCPCLSASIKVLHGSEQWTGGRTTCLSTMLGLVGLFLFIC
jgi:hypothetical protein